MMPPAVRSQLLRLRADLAAAVDGRDLLDRKREAIVRALADRAPRRDALLQEASARLGIARAALGEAQLEHGRAAIDAAAIAQPALPPPEVTEASIVGVRVPQILFAADRFQPQYGAGAGLESLDRAGALFVAALAPVVAFAAEDTAVRRLRAALARTARRLNALDKALVPEIRRQIHALASALEEDERDEAVRRNMWLASASRPVHRSRHRRGEEIPGP